MDSIQKHTTTWKIFYFLGLVAFILFALATILAFSFPFEITLTRQDGTIESIGPKAIYRDFFFGLQPLYGACLVLTIIIIKYERNLRQQLAEQGVYYKTLWHDLFSTLPTVTIPQGKQEWMRLLSISTHHLLEISALMFIALCHMSSVIGAIGGIVILTYLPNYSTLGYVALGVALLGVLVPFLTLRHTRMYALALEMHFGPYNFRSYQVAEASITHVEAPEEETAMKLLGQHYWPYSGVYLYGERYIRVQFTDRKIGIIDTAIRVGRKKFRSLVIGQKVPIRYQIARIGTKVRAKLTL